jgi:hypothetical protein
MWFDNTDRAIQNSFLPALLVMEATTAEQRALMAQGVKQAGLAICNPVDCVQVNFDVSKRTVDELCESMVSGTRFSL